MAAVPASKLSLGQPRKDSASGERSKPRGDWGGDGRKESFLD